MEGDDLLVRVSRRVACGHYASVLANACLDPSWPHYTPGYNTPPRGGHIPGAFVRPLEPTLARQRTSTPPLRAAERPRQVWQQELPFQQFHVLFDSLSKVLFIFRSLYLCAIGLRPIFSLRRNLPPAWSCIPKQLDSSKGLLAATEAQAYGALTLHDAPFQGTWPGTDTETPSTNYNSNPREG